MSCNCDNTTNTQQFSCECDSFTHPPPLRIAMGLADLPRQAEGFAEFRRAMLYALRSKPALNKWQARHTDDHGLMLLEMWAYVCDVLSFYDKLVAQESYIRPAMLRTSLRKLTALLGYLPTPAIASTVFLAARADGRQLVKLPAGIGFRSTAFDGNPPQVFESGAEQLIHPFNNCWNLRAPHYGKTVAANSLLIDPFAEIKAGMQLLLTDSNDSNNQAVSVKNVSTYTGRDARLYTSIVFATNMRIGAGYPLEHLQLLMFSQTAAPWSLGDAVSHDQTIVLDGVYRELKQGQYIVIARDTDARWFRIKTVTETLRAQTPQRQIGINGNTFSMPGTLVPLTSIHLDAKLNDAQRKDSTAPNWNNNDMRELTIHFAAQPAGNVTDEPMTILHAGDRMFVEEEMEASADATGLREFLLRDKNTAGLQFTGQVDYNHKELLPIQELTKDLALPVEAFGNVIRATHGETVLQEILGSGDATLINQRFKLKKKPLTYLPSAVSVSGIQNTLEIYVDNIKWQETRSFYNKKPTDEIYIVRQDDEGESHVIFGDGIHGRRLPTGTDNVKANYRHGAGEPAPPADSVKQIVKPVKGLISVNNILAAGGGADAESAESLRKLAPRTALVLGRAVSIKDMEAVALSVNGVKAAKAEWRWHGAAQTAVAHVWYAGNNVQNLVAERLAGITDVTADVRVEEAEPIKVQLRIDVSIDPRYLVEPVLDALRKALIDEEDGMLSVKNTGIGNAVFRSRIFSMASSIRGLIAVNRIYWYQHEQAPGNDQWEPHEFSTYGKAPGAGEYFYIDNNSLHLNGNPYGSR